MPLLGVPPVVPPVGRIFGVRINVDTMGDLERRLGKGLPAMGGHSGGARVWVDPRRGWTLYADGFEYARRGRRVEAYVEALRLTASGGWAGRPPAMRAADYGVLAAVRPGMARAEVRRALRSVRGSWTRDTLSQPGRAVVRHATNPDVERLTRWQAEFLFHRGRLDSITLRAE